MNIIILLGLVLGIIGWVFHLLFILKSAKSRYKWTLFLDYNTKKEAIPELILFILIIIITIIGVVLYLS